MKEITIRKKAFECETCNTVYNTEEAAINCEKNHKRFESLPIKCIIITEDVFSIKIIINVYKNAIYRKEDDSISLYKGGYFVDKSHYCFDEIRWSYDLTEFRIYTTNFDEDYEKDCIKRLIDYRMNQLNQKIAMLKETDWTKNIQKNDY